MAVSEEIDALLTLGLDPYRHLVYPRVIGLVLVVRDLREVVSFIVELLPGREEARLIYLGVAHAQADDEGTRLVIAGQPGSTGFIAAPATPASSQQRTGRSASEQQRWQRAASR